MNEGYKLSITKERNDGTKKSMAAIYPLRQECLVSLEEDFEKGKKEPDVVEIRLFRFDENGVHELRRYLR